MRCRIINKLRGQIFEKISIKAYIMENIGKIQKISVINLTGFANKYKSKFTFSENFLIVKNWQKIVLIAEMETDEYLVYSHFQFVRDLGRILLIVF